MEELVGERSWRSGNGRRILLESELLAWLIRFCGPLLVQLMPLVSRVGWVASAVMPVAMLSSERMLLIVILIVIFFSEF